MERGEEWKGKRRKGYSSTEQSKKEKAAFTWRTEKDKFWGLK